MWVKEHNDVGEVSKIVLEDDPGGIPQPRKRPSLGDEEKVISPSLGDKSTTRTSSWRTGITLW